MDDDFINDDDDIILGSTPSTSPVEDDYIDTSSVRIIIDMIK